jgi:DNA adenine methylase
MTKPPLVPPMKCQGIKTKLVGQIAALAHDQQYRRWVEPFCGSCVVPLNIQPNQALLNDSNVHMIRLYREIQNGSITPNLVKSFLTEEGGKLRKEGGAFYYEVRDRFNANPTSLDFIFLNRSCFNGVMRFNRAGKFNVPYGHKPERFAQAYVTKITNQVRRLSDVISASNWTFTAVTFQKALEHAKPGDMIYVDPPYAGRHVDYYNSWSDNDEIALAEALKELPCKFILSTWHSNKFRKNHWIERHWTEPGFYVLLREHFYHVGSTEDLRHPMIEALITNFAPTNHRPSIKMVQQPTFL